MHDAPKPEISMAVDSPVGMSVADTPVVSIVSDNYHGICAAIKPGVSVVVDNSAGRSAAVKNGLSMDMDGGSKRKRGETEDTSVKSHRETMSKSSVGTHIIRHQYLVFRKNKLTMYFLVVK